MPVEPAMYASTAERMITAIGEPEFVDTAKDARLGRIFMNRTLKVYPAFKDFYGLEETIERIVGFFRHAAQGLEEKKQILYLLGPVGGGKSSTRRSAEGPDGEVPDLRPGHQRWSQSRSSRARSASSIRPPWVARSRIATAFRNGC